jgi:hypothetical protein
MYVEKIQNKTTKYRLMNKVIIKRYYVYRVRM